MKIVVCDDDEKFLKEFKTVLQERLTSLEIEAELTMYSTGKKLVEVCEPVSYTHLTLPTIRLV